MDEITPLLGAGLNATLSVPLAAMTAEVDPETCQLLGPVALVVQGLMGLIVMGSLVLKRAQEKPKRKWKVWLGDVGKQIVGQAFVHASNVLISDLIARHATHDNPCSLYALNILVDTTLGVVILFGFLKLSTRLMMQVDPGYKTGDYGTPFEWGTWARQAAVYVACLFGMKVVVLLLFWAFPVLFKFANWALTWLPTDDAQVVFVMLIFPLVMNLFQFLTIDSILRSKSPLSSAFLSPDLDEESRRGFLEPSSDDVDSDDEGHDDEDSKRKRGTAGARGEVDSGYEGATGSPPYTRSAGGDVSGGRRAGEESGTSTPRGVQHGHLGAHSYPPAPPPPPALNSRAVAAPAQRAPSPTPHSVIPPTFTSIDEKQFSLVADRSAADASEPTRGSGGGEDSEEDWGADWGVESDGAASMTSLELRREVEGMVREDEDVGDDWGLEMDEKASMESERRREIELDGGKKFA